MKRFQKAHITQQHEIIEREFCVYLTFSFSLFTSFDRREAMFAIRKIAFVIFATPTKQFMLADEEFSSKKTQITEQHGITGAYSVYLTFSFSLFTSFNRQEVMFAIRKIAFVIFVTPTKQFLLADEEFSSKKLKELSSMEVQNVSFAFISRFHFQYSHHSTDGKWCLFAIQKITKAIFATPTKQFLLADKEFSSKTHINQQHGITEREYCAYLTFSFSLFTSFNRQEMMFVCDSKDQKKLPSRHQRNNLC